MAKLGWWDGELRPDGWWDAEVQPAAWWDTEAVETAVPGVNLQVSWVEFDTSAGHGHECLALESSPAVASADAAVVRAAASLEASAAESSHFAVADIGVSATEAVLASSIVSSSAALIAGLVEAEAIEEVQYGLSGLLVSAIEPSVAGALATASTVVATAAQEALAIQDSATSVTAVQAQVTETSAATGSQDSGVTGFSVAIEILSASAQHNASSAYQMAVVETAGAVDAALASAVVVTTTHEASGAIASSSSAGVYVAARAESITASDFFAGVTASLAAVNERAYATESQGSGSSGISVVTEPLSVVDQPSASAIFSEMSAEVTVAMGSAAASAVIVGAQAEASPASTAQGALGSGVCAVVETAAAGIAVHANATLNALAESGALAWVESNSYRLLLADVINAASAIDWHHGALYASGTISEPGASSDESACFVASTCMYVEAVDAGAYAAVLASLLSADRYESLMASSISSATSDFFSNALEPALAIDASFIISTSGSAPVVVSAASRQFVIPAISRDRRVASTRNIKV